MDLVLFDVVVVVVVVFRADAAIKFEADGGGCGRGKLSRLLANDDGGEDGRNDDDDDDDIVVGGSRGSMAVDARLDALKRRFGERKETFFEPRLFLFVASLLLLLLLLLLSLLLLLL